MLQPHDRGRRNPTPGEGGRETNYVCSSQVKRCNRMADLHVTCNPGPSAVICGNVVFCKEALLVPPILEIHTEIQYSKTTCDFYSVHEPILRSEVPERRVLLYTSNWLLFSDLLLVH